MSDRDTFIEEVSEEVRRDRLFALWRRYGPYILGAIALAVAGAGLQAWLAAQETAKARAAGGALITASAGDAAAQTLALTDLADTTDHEGEALVALLRAASIRAAEGDAEGAAALYDRVAAMPDADPLYGDFARFRAVMLRGDAMAPGAFADALSPIANANGPFRLLALEARGVALHRAGDDEAAASELRAAYLDEAAPQAMRQRIEAVMTAIGAPLQE